MLKGLSKTKQYPNYPISISIHNIEFKGYVYGKRQKLIFFRLPFVHWSEPFVHWSENIHLLRK